MRVTLSCPHGMRVVTEDAPERSDAYWRLWLRNTLLACPACYSEAANFIERELIGP